MLENHCVFVGMWCVYVCVHVCVLVTATLGGVVHRVAVMNFKCFRGGEPEKMEDNDIGMLGDGACCKKIAVMNGLGADEVGANFGASLCCS